MSFFTPLALGLSALAIPLIMLYMLRLRRTEMPISSTFLWQQLVRDQEANAPWQRLRFSWLLLLQLLILAALVIALARPFTEVSTITTGRIVLLLDASASMQAGDVAPDRFTVARNTGLELVDALGPDDTMTVIRVGAVPEVLAAASRDKTVLRDAIENAESGEVSADWFGAMTLAAAGAVGVDELKVVIITDGGLPSDLPAVPGDVRFVQVGREASNLAISALATGILPGREPELFVRISNYGDIETDVIMDIRVDNDDELYTARRYTIPPRDFVEIFNIELPESFDTLTAELTMPRNAAMPDYLAVDDVAYAVRDRSGAGRVLLVTEGNRFLENIFRSLRGVELFQTEPESYLPRDEYDLTVFDGWLPSQLPEGDLLIVDPPFSTDLFQVIGDVKPTGDVTVNLADPRMRNLEVFMKSVNVQMMQALTGIEDWGTVLAELDGWPLVIAGEYQTQQVAILPFNARYPNTDIVLQPAWPVLIAELAAWFSPPRIINTVESLPPGAPVTIRFIENAEEAIITRPNNRRVTLKPDGSEVVFVDTLQSGLYQVDLRREGEIVKSEHFAVNLFDSTESQIEPKDNVIIGTSTISQDARAETGYREFWPWLLGLGIAFLMLEWALYHRSLQRLPQVTVGGLSGRLPQGTGWRVRLAQLMGRTSGSKRAPARRR